MYVFVVWQSDEVTVNKTWCRVVTVHSHGEHAGNHSNTSIAEFKIWWISTSAPPLYYVYIDWEGTAAAGRQNTVYATGRPYLSRRDDAN